MYKNFSNYEILEDGRIWSKVRKKFLKPYLTKPNGYQMVCLYDNNGKKHFETLHKVVFCAVNGVWEFPEGYELDLIDENKMNNHISNLRLCTHQENCNFGTRNERVAKVLSKRVGAFKNNELVMCFPSTMEAQRNGFKQSNICNCCNGKLPHYKGYEWRYLDE